MNKERAASRFSRAFFALICLCVLVSFAAAAQSKKKPPEKPLDLNSATLEELQQLPGVGSATAKAIVRFREKSGPFRRVEELLAIPRITKRRLEKIRAYVMVGKAEEKARN